MRCIVSARQQFLETPIETPYISTWKRVAAAIPNIFDLLISAVKEDNKE